MTCCIDLADENNWPRMNDAQTATAAHVLALIRASLAVWEVAATVGAEPDGRWLITPDDQPPAHVGRAPPAIPFRWLVTTAAGRERPASSVAGLLRILRSTLDPNWRPGRARVVSLTLPAP